MEHVEGRQSVLAALGVYQRRFQVILIRHDAPREKLADVIELAGQRGVPIRYVEAAELDGPARSSLRCLPAGSQFDSRQPLEIRRRTLMLGQSIL